MGHVSRFIWNGTCQCVAVSTSAQSKGAELERRFISFAVDIISLSNKLPKTLPSRHICKQIIRSGTATAANYGEARAAECRADFIHKLGVVLKELNETGIWLQLILGSSLLTNTDIGAVIADNRELSRIIT